MLTSNQHAQIQVQPVKSLPLHLEVGAQTFVPLKPRLHTHPHSRSHQLYVVSVVDKLYVILRINHIKELVTVFINVSM